MQALLPLILPTMSLIVAITFAIIARHSPRSLAARSAAYGFLALSFCVLIDAERWQLAAWVVFFVVPLQLCAIISLCQAAVTRVGQTMPRALVAPLFSGAAAVHAYLFLFHPDLNARGLSASAVSAVLLGVAATRLRPTARTSINRLMMTIAIWSALTFGARAALIAGGVMTIIPEAPLTGSSLVILFAVIHVLTTMVWSVGLLLAIGKDLIDYHHRVTHVDPLTGLGNRRALDAAIKEDGLEGPLYSAAMVIDLDHFKAINDSHGHEAGDIVPTKVAGLLAAQLGTMAHVSRIGGEEFAVLVPRAQSDLAHTLAQAALADIANLSFLPRSLKVTASIGLAHRAEHEDLRSLLRRADVALYRAKGKGRDQIAVDKSYELKERMHAVA